MSTDPNSLRDLPILTQQPRTEKIILLFIGTMTYGPNEDAAIYFCKEILPALKEKFPGMVELLIVGRGPSPAVSALGKDPAVKVTGGVDSVEPYYEKAHVVIAPIRFGGGTRIKILEALAFGRPVVSTTIGAEGLDLKPSRDILIADTPEDFALACIQLAFDDELRQRIAESGRKRFSELYEADRVQRKMICDLREIIAIDPVISENNGGKPVEIVSEVAHIKKEAVASARFGLGAGRQRHTPGLRKTRAVGPAENRVTRMLVRGWPAEHHGGKNQPAAGAGIVH